MAQSYLKNSNLAERDLDFLIATVSGEIQDSFSLKQGIRTDEDVRNSYVGDEKVFRRLMDDDEAFLKISPALFFEILLRQAASDLERRGYTLEKSSHMKIPVFDTQEVIGLLGKEPFILYLADMLASFTKIESYVISVRVGKDIFEKIRFNNMDIPSLMRFCQVVEEKYRLALYKRIADICLFLMGIFPDYVERDYRYPFSGEVRPYLRGKLRMRPEDYEEEGRRFFKLAAEHPSAQELALAEVFLTLHENFHQARKPLNFLAEHYLPFKRHKFFL